MTAFELDERACELGSAQGCNDLGVRLMEERGRKPDPERAFEMYRKACELGLPMGCTNLGYVYEKGVGTSADRDRALSSYERSCTAGEPLGCEHLGDLVYDDEAPDAKLRALRAYEQACKGGRQGACSGLGMMYGMGIGVARDRYRAVELLEGACAANVVIACTGLGMIRLQPGDGLDVEGGKNALSHACDEREPHACYLLAGTLRTEDPDAHATDIRHLLERGCDFKHEPSCQALREFNAGD
ncbi:MAG TPA: tetratricopeptide repeat protein [Polyangiaceae bacterium]|nr:tetratricopeptide repeat protein [Polyangiaceae bacterium]